MGANTDRLRQLINHELKQVLRPAQPETMSADQVADYLGVDRKTVYDYANRGVIPCRKLGKRLLFSRLAIVAWLRCESALPQQGR